MPREDQIPPPLGVSPEALRSICERHGILRLAVFGSFLRGEPTPGSDLDLLVEFAPGCTPGLRFFTIEAELSDLFARPVDLNTKGFLSPDFADRVAAEARTIYAAA